jgi:hypothetical protein
MEKSAGYHYDPPAGKIARDKSRAKRPQKYQNN